MADQTLTMAALADPTRRTIFERLAASPSSVADLAVGLPVSRPAVSQHLKVLKRAGIVTDHAVGTRRIYTVDPQTLAEIREYFDQVWRQSLATFREAAEKHALPTDSTPSSTPQEEPDDR